MPTDEEEIFNAATDDQGQEGPAQAPQATAAPEIGTPPADDLSHEGEGSQPQQGTQDRTPGPVPYAALKEEREARKALQQRLDQQDALLTRLLQSQAQPAHQQPAKEPDPEPDFWADPHASQQHLRKEILGQAEAQIQETREYYSRQMAELRHTPEKVEEAYQALFAAARGGEINGDAVLAQLRRSPDPYGEIMRWHSQRSVLSQVGSDPQAYREKVRAEILAEMQGQGQAPAGQQAAGGAPRPGTPNLPSLTRAFGNAGTGQGGAISEEDIFNAAPAFGKSRKT